MKYKLPGTTMRHDVRTPWPIFLTCLLLAAAWSLVGVSTARSAEPPTVQEFAQKRVQTDLQASYDFSSASAEVVADRSGAGQPLDLHIADPKAVRVSSGELEILAGTLIRTEKPAARLIDSIAKSGAITIEAWIRPANPTQNGPARIVTLSRNSGERNFTMGQDGDRIEVRLRTTKTSTNGIPAVVSKSKSLGNDWTHVVYTFSRAGQARLYINGVLNIEQNVGGAVSNWDGGYQLALANELSRDRPWLGSYRLVAIYSRDLTTEEVGQNYRAGAGILPGQPGTTVALRNDANVKLFETQIAPLLAAHCLECHDTPSRKGRLDLSQKAPALAGGKSGSAVVPGDASTSRLWQRIASDEMPPRPPALTAAEKALFKQWLDGGAAWTLDVIDPAVYAQGEGSQHVFVQRLTVSEYIETVRRTVGVDIAADAGRLLPRDLRADGFRNTAYNLNVDLAHVEAYAKLAEIIVGKIDFRSLAAKYTKSRELTDENVSKVIEPFGRRVLRGPLSKEEIAVYCGISTSVAGAGGNFEEALRYVVEAMLQSPRFIYRIESQQGDGSSRAVGPYELASRLSYILWGGPPDDALLTAAEKGALDRVGVESQARRMLQDRRAVERSREFIAEWLNLDRLDNLRPDQKRFPHWDGQLAADMRHETLAFFEEVVWTQQRPLADLLNAQVTFVTPRLAKHYGLPPDKPSTGDAPARYDLSAVPGRGGLLTQGSVLTVGGDNASTVARGLFIMHELLRGVVRDPPPCVDTSPVSTRAGLTQRAIAESRIANKSCSGCHSKFEPLSFGIGKFDGLGTYLDSDEYGNALRDDGSLLIPGHEQPIPYQSAAEMMDLLARSERVRESLTWKVTQFSLGRPLGAAAAPILADIHRTAQQGGGTYASLMTAIVTSDLVLTTRTENAAPAHTNDKNKQP
jgi:hypothetical protein